MIEPSSIRHPQGYKRIIREVKPGLYRVENAYEGEYVYFENDSFEHQQSSPNVIIDAGEIAETVESELSVEEMRQLLGTTEPAITEKLQTTDSSGVLSENILT
jgi:hypothetical protein